MIQNDEAERVINGYEDPDGYKNERLPPIIYELDKRQDWVNEECWQAILAWVPSRELTSCETRLKKRKPTLCWSRTCLQ